MPFMDETPVVGPERITEGLGAFDELEFLGRGTFGETYRALRGEDEFALKVIHAEDMPGWLWKRETESLQRIDHPNVMKFRRAGSFEVEGVKCPYMECEYIDGDSVRKRLQSDGPITDSAELRALLSGLLAGLSEMHDLGMIHRDIKPANIALRGNEWGEPVFLDFGLAKAIDMTSHTNLGDFRGTPKYAAPEQLRREDARTRSDMFSVGVVVYEAGTGQHPFATSDGTGVQWLHEQIGHGAADPRADHGHWPDDVAEVVLRFLSYQAHDRLTVARAIRDIRGI